MSLVKKYLPSFHDLMTRFFIGTGRRITLSTPVRDGMVVANVEAMYATIYFILVSGAFLTGAVLYIGFNDLHIGILGAIPAFATIPGLVGAYLAESLRSRKKVIVPSVIIGRSLWIVLILLIVMRLNASAKIWLFLSIYLVASMLNGMAGTAWQGWMSDLVPEQIRGRFFGRRNRVLNFASILTLLGGGCLLDWFKDSGKEGAGYVVIFGIGVLFAAFSSIALKKQYEPPLHPLASTGFWKNLVRPFKDRHYMQVVRAFAAFNFSIGLSAAFFSAYMLKHLELSYFEISMFTILSLFIGMFFNPFWGYMMDKVGLKPVLLFNLAIIAVIPIVWTLSLSFGIGLVWLVWLLVGIGWSGYNIAAFNLPFALSPKDGRTYYLGVLSIINGVIFFCASILAGVFAQRFQNLDIHIGPFHVINYHLLFVASATGRFLSGFLFRRVRDVKSKGMLYMIQYTSSVVYTKLITARKIVLFPLKNKTATSRNNT